LRWYGNENYRLFRHPTEGLMALQIWFSGWKAASVEEVCM